MRQRPVPAVVEVGARAGGRGTEVHQPCARQAAVEGVPAQVADCAAGADGQRDVAHLSLDLRTHTDLRASACSTKPRAATGKAAPNPGQKEHESDCSVLQ